MIPLQVRIKGLMRYREEQVADFRDGNLIAICGENGAGKSSIFDAITFALYGQALRVNARQTQDLISDGGADYVSVTFVFEEAGSRYQVIRERDRHHETKEGGKVPGRSAFLLSQWDSTGETWVPLPRTDTASGLQSVLGSIVKLSEQAFTSSYLLGQDAATAFIDLSGADRFKTVSGLIGLEEYEALAKAAREKGLLERARVIDSDKKLVEYAGVTPAALAQVRQIAGRERAEAEMLAKAIGVAKLRAADAATYVRLRGEIETLDGRIEAAALLIAAKDETEADARRFEEVGKLVDAVSKVEAELALADEGASSANEARAAVAAIDLDALETAADEASAAAARTSQSLADAEKARGDAAMRERKASDFKTTALTLIAARERVGACETRVTELEAALAGLPALQAESERLTAIRDALPALSEWKRALEQLEALAALKPDETKTRLETTAGEVEGRVATLDADVAKLTEAAQVAGEAASRVQAELSNLEVHLAQRVESADEAVCSRCGQPIDAAAAHEEIEELQRRLDGVHECAAKSAYERDAAQSSLQTASAALREGQSELAGVKTELVTASIRVEQLETATAAAKGRSEAFRKAAPKELSRSLTAASDSKAIVLVLAKNGQTPVEAGAAQRKVTALLGLQGELTSARRERVDAESRLQEAVEAVGGRLEDVDGAACAHDAAVAALSEAERALSETREGAELAAREAGAAREARQQAIEERGRLEAAAAQHETRATGHRRAATLVAGGIDSPLREEALTDAASVLVRLAAERGGLKDAPERLARLRAAETEHAHLLGERSAKQAEAQQIPEAHRVEVDVAAADLLETESRSAAAAEQARQAEADANLTEERLAQRQTLEMERDLSQTRQRQYRKLTTLLGRAGVQGVLVTDALNSITSNANSFLKRLMGGTLEIILNPNNRGTEEIELQAIDHSAMRAERNIQALSGSQKFRCAVALAFGIGQYAGAGGMRSMMIDEGFGGLDEAGQRQMVEELKNLATHMDKVIVVSHLEAFRDRDNFPHQISIEKRGDSSVIVNSF